jgi:transcriptional regulator with XRE-family HTH domain
LSNIVTRRVKNPRFEILAAIAKDLGIPLQWLLNGDANFSNDYLNGMLRDMPDDLKQAIVTADPSVRQYLDAGIRLAVDAYQAHIPIIVLQKGYEVAKKLQE